MKTFTRPAFAPINGAGPGSGNLRAELTRRELQRVAPAPRVEPLTLDDLKRDGYTFEPERYGIEA